MMIFVALLNAFAAIVAGVDGWYATMAWHIFVTLFCVFLLRIW